MGVALPWQWFIWLFGCSVQRAQVVSYLTGPLLVMATVAVIQFLQPHSFCLFQHLLHIPCPGCGITRSIYAILSGNYADAWSYNPCGFIVVIALIGQSIISALELLSFVNCRARLTFALQSNTVLTISLLSFWPLRLSSMI